MRLSLICCLSSFVFAWSLVICWQRVRFCTTDRAALQKSLSTWRWHSSSCSLWAPHHTLSSLCACYNLSPSGCARPSPLFVLRKPLILSLECLPLPDSVATTCDCQLHTQSNYKLLGEKTKPFLHSSAEMWQSNFPFCTLLKSRCLCSFSSSVSLVCVLLCTLLCVYTECVAGRFGADCQQRCECENSGQCDRRTGRCSCSAGWIGERCEKGETTSEKLTHPQKLWRHGEVLRCGNSTTVIAVLWGFVNYSLSFAHFSAQRVMLDCLASAAGSDASVCTELHATMSPESASVHQGGEGSSVTKVQAHSQGKFCALATSSGQNLHCFND